MARDLILAIDAGTSVIKVLAFDLDGNEVATAARPNSYRTGTGGAVDQDMARTWRDTVAVLRELTESNAGLASRAAALAVTGQGDGTWLVDRDGVPVAPAWLWLDARAAGAGRGNGRQRRAPPHVSAYRLRPQCLQPEWAARLDGAAHAGSPGPRRDRAPLQGLALSQPHRPARDRRDRGYLHLRRFPHPALCAGDPGVDGDRQAPASAARPDRRYAHDAWADRNGGQGNRPAVRLAGIARQRRRRLLLARRRPLRAGAECRLLHHRLNWHEHALRAQRQRPDIGAGARRLHHGLSGRWRGRADAVDHGGHHQHRLDRRGRPRRRQGAGPRGRSQGGAEGARCAGARGQSEFRDLPPLHPRGRRARALHQRQRARAVHRPHASHQLRGPGAHGL